MAFTKRASAVAVLFVALLGNAMTSVMVRRAAPDTTLSSTGSTAAGGDVGVNAPPKPSSPAAAPATDVTEGGKLTETGAAEATGETEKAGEATAETETEEQDETIDDDTSDEEYPDVGFQTGIVFGSPFVTLRQMQRYFFELERALHKVFENTLNEAAQSPDMKNNTTTEEVTVSGHKYLVNRTVITGGDENSTVVIKAISIVPQEQRRKRAVMEFL